MSSLKAEQKQLQEVMKITFHTGQCGRHSWKALRNNGTEDSETVGRNKKRTWLGSACSMLRELRRDATCLDKPGLQEMIASMEKELRKQNF